MHGCGVYFLIGRNDDQIMEKVYIGESEDVLCRINQHLVAGSKEWQDWTECIMFLSKSDELNKAKIKYLESSLCELAKDADRCELNNGNKPRKSALSEIDETEMKEYLSNLRLLMGAMGHSFLEPLVKLGVEKIEGIEYHLSSKKSDYDAKGHIVNEGFVVLKGSKISDIIADTFKGTGYYNIREKLISDGIIKDRIFTKDYLFSSYSAAGTVVSGYRVNGWLVWKDEEGRSINENLSEHQDSADQMKSETE